MKPALFAIFLSLPFALSAQTVTAPNSATAFQIMNAQQQYILQQQQAQLAALQNQQSAGVSPQTQALIQLAAHYCPLMFGGDSKSPMGSGGSKMKKTAREIEDVTWKTREKAGAIKEKNVDADLAKVVGGDIAEKLSPECGSFLNKEGKMGPSGSYLFQQIRDKKEILSSSRSATYAKKICPSYSKMSADQQDLFWLWTMTAKASADSKCVNKGVGSGFFAVKPEECPKQNGQSTPQTLQCGVDLLVKDIRDQGVSGTKISFLKEEDRRLAGLYRYCKE